MISDKRLIIVLFSIIVFFGAHAFLFAQENESQVKEEVKEGFTYQMALSLSLSPILESKADDGRGKNHFAAIKGINVPVPYAQFVAMYTKPLDFGDNPILSGANIAFIAGPTLTPITFDTQAGIIFTPSSILNIGLGATAGSGWAIGDAHGIGLYNSITDKYEQSLPFTVWRYSLI